MISIILKLFPIILSFKDIGNQKYIINDIIYYEYCYNNINRDCKNVNTNKLKTLYVIYWWLVPIGIITYITLITLRAFINVNLKWFMDLKYISSNKILMIYGLLGSILSSIACIITTFVKCEETKSNNKDIYDYICIDQINDHNNTTSKYFDNFFIYYKNLNFSEILKLLYQVFCFFFYKYFSMLIIKFLTPVHLILYIPNYYIIQKTVLIINTIIRNKSFFNKFYFTFRSEKFFIDSLGDIISSFGLLIYLEIIELNFCKLNYNLRRNIIRRGRDEIFNSFENIEENIIDEESND